MADTMNQSMNFNEIPNLALSSRHYSNHFQKPSLLSYDIPFQKAFPLITSVTPPRQRFIDVYVDDFISACLDTSSGSVHESETCFNIITNVFSLFFNPTTTNLPNELIRSVALSIRKLSGDGAPTEIKKILGWVIDTRRMIIAMSNDKFTKWTKSINDVLSNGYCSLKELERLIGKLVRTSRIIPGSQCYLKPIRK